MGLVWFPLNLVASKTSSNFLQLVLAMIWVDLIIHSRLHARLLTSYQLVCWQVSVQCLPSGSTSVVCIVFGIKQWKNCCSLCHLQMRTIHSIYSLYTTEHVLQHVLQHQILFIQSCLPACVALEVIDRICMLGPRYSIQGSGCNQQPSNTGRHTGLGTITIINHENCLHWIEGRCIQSFLSQLFQCCYSLMKEISVNWIHWHVLSNSFYFNCPEQVVFWTPCKLRHQASGSGGILLDGWGKLHAIRITLALINLYKLSNIVPILRGSKCDKYYYLTTEQHLCYQLPVN